MNRSLAVCSFLCFLLAFSAISLAHVDMQGDGGGHSCTEAPPDTFPDPDPVSWDPLGLYHRYGTEPGEFDIAIEFPTFNNIFELYLTDDVATRWDSTTVAYFIDHIVDEDSTNTDDIFPKVMKYFTDNDEDPRYGHVEYHTPDDSVYTKFVIKLYSDHDVTQAVCGGTYGGNYSRECQKYSMAFRPFPGEFPYRPYTVLLLATDKTKDCGPLTDVTVDDVLTKAFAHEFQHVCFALQNPYSFYYNVNESLAKLAEHIVGGTQDVTCDISYDTSVLRGDRCEPERKYMAEYTWMSYLYDAYIGNPSDITDDLAYRWIRQASVVNALRTEVTLRSLANTLDDGDYAFLGGATGEDRLKNLFQAFTVAKFADAPDFGDDERYGYSGLSPARDLGLMMDNCTFYAPGSCPLRPIDCGGVSNQCSNMSYNHSGCWNVRIIPPDYELDSGIENATASVEGIYEDADGSRDSVEVATYGTDYIVFRADSYYSSGSHEFHFRMDQRRPTLQSNMELRASVIGYSAAEDTLQLHPEDIVFIEPLNIEAGGNAGSVVVTDFGRSIQAVVVCITLVETVPQPGSSMSAGLIGSAFQYYVYDYEYGVYTPSSASDVSWDGDVFMTGDYTVPDGKTLTVDAGTRVHVWPEDIPEVGYDHDRIEFNVEGELIAEGTSVAPITFGSWAGENDDDWTGFFITDNAPATGVFDHVNIKNATKAIQARAAFTIKNSVIEDCKYIGVTIAGDSANADSVYARHLTIRHIGGTGAIGVNALGKKAAICMDSCLVDDCRVGIETYTKAKLYTSHTTVSNSSLYDIWVHGRAYANIFYSNVESAGTTALKISDAASVESELTTYKTSDFGVDIGAHTGSMPEAVFTSCVFRQNGSGIRVPDLAYVSANDCTVNNNTTGLECLAYADVEWSGSTFKHNTYAVKADGWSSSDFVDTKLSMLDT